jgi:hypothetical protein
MGVVRKCLMIFICCFYCCDVHSASLTNVINNLSVKFEKLALKLTQQSRRKRHTDSDVINMKEKYSDLKSILKSGSKEDLSKYLYNVIMIPIIFFSGKRKKSEKSKNGIELKDRLVVLSMLLEKGAEPNYLFRGSDNSLLLLIATYKEQQNYYEIADLLLSWGANPNIIARWGATPLIYAIEQAVGYDLIKLLLMHGANPNQLCTWGNIIPFVLAIETTKNKKIINLFFKYGANNAESLASAIINIDTEVSLHRVISLLIGHGAKPELISTNFDNKLLNNAVKKVQDKEILHKIVACICKNKKADQVFEPDSIGEGNNVFLLALKKGVPVKTLRVLLDAEVDCTIVNNHKKTIFHLIIENYDHEDVRLIFDLLFSGKSVILDVKKRKLVDEVIFIESGESKTPFMCAAKIGNIYLLNLFVELVGQDNKKRLVEQTNVNKENAMSFVPKQGNYVDQCGNRREISSSGNEVFGFLSGLGLKLPRGNLIINFLRSFNMNINSFEGNHPDVRIDNTVEAFEKLPFEKILSTHKSLYDTLMDCLDTPQIFFNQGVDANGMLRNFFTMVVDSIFKRSLLNDYPLFAFDSEGLCVSQFEYNNIDNIVFCRKLFLDLVERIVNSKKDLLQICCENPDIFTKIILNETKEITIDDKKKLLSMKIDLIKNSDQARQLVAEIISRKKTNVESVTEHNKIADKMLLGTGSFENLLSKSDYKKQYLKVKENKKHMQDVLEKAYYLIAKLMYLVIVRFEIVNIGVNIHPFMLHFFFVENDSQMIKILFEHSINDRGRLAFLKKAWSQCNSLNQEELKAYFFNINYTTDKKIISNMVYGQIIRGGSAEIPLLWQMENINLNFEVDPFTVERSLIANELLSAWKSGFSHNGLLDMDKMRNLIKDFFVVKDELNKFSSIRLQTCGHTIV